MGCLAFPSPHTSCLMHTRRNGRSKFTCGKVGCKPRIAWIENARCHLPHPLLEIGWISENCKHSEIPRSQKSVETSWMRRTQRYETGNRVDSDRLVLSWLHTTRLFQVDKAPSCSPYVSGESHSESSGRIGCSRYKRGVTWEVHGRSMWACCSVFCSVIVVTCPYKWIVHYWSWIL